MSGASQSTSEEVCDGVHQVSSAAIAHAEERASRVWALPEVRRLILEHMKPTAIGRRIRLVNRATLETHSNIRFRELHLKKYKKLVRQMIPRVSLSLLAVCG